MPGWIWRIHPAVWCAFGLVILTLVGVAFAACAGPGWFGGRP